VAHSLSFRKPHGPSVSKMLLDVNFLDEDHYGSSRSVANMHGARLKRSREG
jgi:hypothetical protein